MSNTAGDATTYYGVVRGRRGNLPFGIHQPDRLLHTYIVGQTGTGKSTLIRNMAAQDIRQERGFCLIDPHGDLASSVAALTGDRCIYWDAADPACPYGYNPLRFVNAAYRPLMASGLIDTLRKQWADAWGARMEHLLRYTILALLERHGSTLADIMPMLLEKEFRQKVLPSISDPTVRHFWTSEFPRLHAKSSEGIAPIANKIGAFLAHPVVRKAVCDPVQPLRFRALMDEGKMVVINLAKGRLGADTANILGGLLISGLSNAAYSRQEVVEAKRRPFFLYVDEFHSFTSSAFADMLSELRKYRVGLVLAHQFSSQLDTAVLDALIGNVGTIMAFRVGAADATTLAKQFCADVPSVRDLVSLPNHEMYVRLMMDGEQSKPFSARA